MKGRSWVVSSKLKSNFQCRREWVVGLASEDPGHKGFLLEACRGRGRKGLWEKASVDGCWLAAMKYSLPLGT